ncbi:histidine phosphatase family protein [Micromonospora musae]|uniref:phosphoglycerate mutase (2,3-diphosphoglycerate-dependent) n=1 Tax=Micromonospora musae TaxID=1894970 RepID=A0A3A9XYT9_9ACTN|nr:histidine phosphatase family protein [Micromonospora musae]RKN30650.1 histidine phosphatase family protein [Micromonospora musae]
MTELAALWIVRHGESTGNVAAQRARSSGAEEVARTERDADVPLSPAGEEQAHATGRWLRTLPPDRRPEVAVTSPYLRARRTAELALAGTGVPLSRDERLRDRDLGIFDRLTPHGVRVRHPEEHERRNRLGKFYYRPPGGEAWTDVALRLRGFLADLRHEHTDRRVMLFGHDVLVFLLSYLLDGLTEEELMALGRRHVIANCSISSWSADHSDHLRMNGFNEVSHLHPTRSGPAGGDQTHYGI